MSAQVVKRRTTHPRRQERRDEAAARQEARAQRSTVDQLRLCQSRRGSSRREVLRLALANPVVLAAFRQAIEADVWLTEVGA